MDVAALHQRTSALLNHEAVAIAAVATIAAVVEQGVGREVHARTAAYRRDGHANEPGIDRPFQEYPLGQTAVAPGYSDKLGGATHDALIVGDRQADERGAHHDLP